MGRRLRTLLMSLGFAFLGCYINVPRTIEVRIGGSPGAESALEAEVEKEEETIEIIEYNDGFEAKLRNTPFGDICYTNSSDGEGWNIYDDKQSVRFIIDDNKDGEPEGLQLRAYMRQLNLDELTSPGQKKSLEEAREIMRYVKDRVREKDDSLLPSTLEEKAVE